MPLATRSASETYASIDELLGDGRERFFSHGYRSTNPQLRDVAVSHTPPVSTLTAHAGLDVQGTWSVKGSAGQTPHLGTTDVLVFAGRTAEILLASRYSPAILSDAHLTSILISGGSSPVEGSLAQLECHATLQTSPGGSTSILRCSVASMTATLEIAHAEAESAQSPHESISELELLGRASTRLYGELWAQRQLSIERIRLDLEAGVAAGQLSLRELSAAVGPRSDRTGLEAAFSHDLAAIEYFVATLQLGQVLLYELDALDRAESNTLWMRKTRITLSHPTARAARASDAGLQVQLRNSRVVLKEDASWRCADIVGSLDGCTVVSSVAHRLPTKAQPSEGSQ